MIGRAWRWLRALWYRPEHADRAHYEDLVTYEPDTLDRLPALAQTAHSFRLGSPYVYGPNAEWLALADAERLALEADAQAAEEWREDWTEAELAALRDLDAMEAEGHNCLEAQAGLLIGECWLHAHWWWYALERDREALAYHDRIEAERRAWRREMGLAA